ncbi:hypothetical protein [Streptomyces sp. ODS28]|uniref:hypothetical protein n=1 Tax=Streptomyces sp. ODS28 TaxID=3136688 RepID=UPI0031ECB1EE
MTREDRRERAADALQSGADAARALQEALKEAGFCFPSLTGGFPVANRGHVELGGLAADEALRLAAHLRKPGR